MDPVVAQVADDIPMVVVDTRAAALKDIASRTAKVPSSASDRATLIKKIHDLATKAI